ncbi:MAG: NfeD family protein [Gemmatimonadales bacterium]
MRMPEWLDVRPDEVRPVTLSFLGAFLVIAFMVLGRALRDAVYITVFPVESLPYVIAAVALASVPTVGIFARQLARHEPRRVLRRTVVIMAAGLALLWPFATSHPAAVVAFYLWTELGTLLLTSGFWIVTAEHFPVRGAKRLYGLIGAGGTAGAMIMGNSISWLLGHLAIGSLVPVLIGLLVAFLVIQSVLPGVAGAISLVLALYAFQILPVNYAGLALLALGIMFMLAEVFVPSFGALGFGGVIAFVIGSIILFDKEGTGYAVSLPLILSLSVISAGFFLFIVGAAVKARQRPVVSGQEELLHSTGEVIDGFAGRGRIRVHGEIWRAESAVPLQRGDRVRVVGVDGLVLKVRPETEES